jgi:hypothetical protein
VLFTSVISCAGDTNPGRFIKAVLWVEDRRRTQVQGTGHPIAKVTHFAIGVIRLIITKVANPRGSFHGVTTAHSFSLKLKALILELSSIMPLLEDKGKRA